MNLLNKFQNVTIQNESRISELDSVYCEKQEKLYRESIQLMESTLNAFTKVYISYSDMDKKNYNTYITEYEELNFFKKRMDAYKEGFIHRVIYHFEKAYNVTLKKEGLSKKYDFSITYNNIIDEIFEQLGGFNFEEKSIKELKDKVRDTIYNEDKIIIKKNKLTINDFVWWNHYSWEGKRLSYSDSKMMPLFKALSHYETGSTDTLFYYKSIFNELYEGEKKHDIFSKYEIGYNLVNSFKVFKNGKIEIVFQTNQQAEEFKREYLVK